MADTIKRDTKITLKQCKGMPFVNAARILNNSFKHSDGRYRPESTKPHTQIDKALLSRWAILDDSDRFLYAKLPMRELVAGCNAFCLDLLRLIEPGLERGEKRLGIYRQIVDGCRDARRGILPQA